MKSEIIFKMFLSIGLVLSICAFIVLFTFYLKEAPKLPDRAQSIDDYMNITLRTESYVLAGETKIFNLDITNKKNETIRKIDMEVEVTYLGKVVYHDQGASIRDYNPGQKVTVYIKRHIPVLTPPGAYNIQLHIKPENLGERYLEYTVYVRPSIYQLLMSLLAIISFDLLLYRFDKMKKLILSLTSFISKKPGDFKHFKYWQQFVCIGIVLLVIAAFTVTFGVESIANQFAIIAYFLILIGTTNNLLEYIKLGDPKINYALSTYLLSAVIYLSIDNGLSKLIGEVATALSLFWAVSNFLKLSNKQRRTTLEISIVPLFLWILFNLARGAVPYYSATAVSLITIHLFVKKLSIPHLTQIADTLIKTTLKFVKPLIRSLDNADSKFRDIAVIYLISILLFFSLSNDGLNELVGKIVAVFVASWATLKLPELTAKQRRLL